MNEETLFHLAREKPPDQRSAFLDEACAGDIALRQRLEILLAADEQPGSFLQSAAPRNGNGESITDVGRTIFQSGVPEGPGTVIGPYKLLQQIGEGGMGVVFMAEQSQPVRRTVALKIIKPGMDSRQVIARFEAERQALAMMDHPNIAKVLDAGTTDSGRPYFVMELVKGVPITKFCDEKQLSVRQRLEVLLPVCQAVQHAHQKGVIHRDLKPTNILVAEYDNRAVPKVIDFGVAKATAQKLTERTMFTEFGQVIGTVEYMSPEQAKFNQLDIDTRSDIYSLGVLLYELLTGSTPFERGRLREAAFDEVLRIIREEEPPKPSTRLSASDTLPSVAANRHTEPDRLSRDVRGELDWIVMKCLEKDRGRRYESASGLAADLEHHLRDEPVRACPPTAAYRFRKFARRNKATLMTVAAVLTFVVIGSAVSTLLVWRAYKREVQAHITEREARTAETKERQRAEANLNVALDGLDAVVRHAEGRFGDDPDAAGLDSEVMQKALHFYEEVAKRNSNDAAVRLAAGKAQSRVGMIQAQIGNFDQAMNASRRAISILEGLPPKLAQSSECRRVLSDCYNRLAYRLWVGAFSSEEAEKYYRKAIELAETLAAEFPDAPENWYLLATNRTEFASFRFKGLSFGDSETEQQLRGALSAFDRIADDCAKTPAHQIVRSETYSRLADLLANQNRREESEQALRAALALNEQIERDFPTFVWQRDRANTLRRRSFNLWKWGRLDEAETAFRDAGKLYEMASAREPNVPAHRYYQADNLRCIGDIQEEDHRVQQAEQSYRSAITNFEAIPDQVYSRPYMRNDMLVAYTRLGELLSAEGRQQDAVDVFRQRLARTKKLTGSAPDSLDFMLELARFHRDADELQQAIEQCIKILAKKPDALEAATMLVLLRLATHDDSGYRDACISLIEQTLPGNPKGNTAFFVAWPCLLSPADGIEYAKLVHVARGVVAVKPSDPDLLLGLGAALYRDGRLEDAAKTLVDAEAAFRRGAATPTPGMFVSAPVIYSQFFLSMTKQRLNHHHEAVEWLKKATEGTDHPSGPADRTWNRRLALRILRAEAEELLKP